MNAAIIYKDTAEGEAANELYYKRKHDRESVIITFNDTSPRSFGTDYRSFGWTAHIIPDVAEPTPGNHPYPSVPTHGNAFMRVISISQGTYQWRLYADAAFSGLGTLYLDMRANDDDQDFIQNVALTKAGADSYWASEAYAEADFPFRVLSSRSERTRIRIRKADNTLSDSIIHLIPVDDVREALVDENRPSTWTTWAAAGRRRIRSWRPETLATSGLALASRRRWWSLCGQRGTRLTTLNLDSNSRRRST